MTLVLLHGAGEVPVSQLAEAWSAPAAVGPWIAVFAFWHVPRFYDYTLAHSTVHELEHLMFVVAGVLVWTQLVDPARRRELSVPRRLLVAASLFAAGTVLSYVLIFS